MSRPLGLYADTPGAPGGDSTHVASIRDQSIVQRHFMLRCLAFARADRFAITAIRELRPYSYSQAIETVWV